MSEKLYLGRCGFLDDSTVILGQYQDTEFLHTLQRIADRNEVSMQIATPKRDVDVQNLPVEGDVVEAAAKVGVTILVEGG